MNQCQMMGRGLLGDKTGGLPGEYQKLSFIGTTAAGPYIDTGVVPTLDTEIRIKFALTSSSAWNLFVFGGEEAYGTNACHVYTNAGYFDIALGNQITTSNMQPRVQITAWHIYEVTIKNNNLKIEDLDAGTTINIPYTPGTLTTANSIYLFALHRASILLGAGVYIFDCDFKNNSVNKQFVACYRKIDGAAGMYDLVNGVFHPNLGTGSFYYVEG